MNAVLCCFALSCQVSFLDDFSPIPFLKNIHCVKSVQIRSFFWSVFGHFSHSDCFRYHVYDSHHLGFRKFQTKCLTDPGIIREFYRYSLCEKCPYSELFWSVFSRIRTE